MNSQRSSSLAWWSAATIFVSAFLLFQVQPVITKKILPWFGGSPAVWTTCVLFFQLVLLGGYAYAHRLTHQSQTRWQGGISLADVPLAVCAVAGRDSSGDRSDCRVRAADRAVGVVEAQGRRLSGAADSAPPGVCRRGPLFRSLDDGPTRPRLLPPSLSRP